MLYIRYLQQDPGGTSLRKILMQSDKSLEVWDLGAKESNTDWKKVGLRPIEI